MKKILHVLKKNKLAQIIKSESNQNDNNILLPPPQIQTPPLIPPTPILPIIPKLLFVNLDCFDIEFKYFLYKTTNFLIKN